MRFLCCLVLGVAMSGCTWYMSERSTFRSGPGALQPVPDPQVPTAPGFGPAIELPPQNMPALPPHDSLKIPDPTTGEFQSRRSPPPPVRRPAPSEQDHVARMLPASQRSERIVTGEPSPRRPALPAGYVELPPPP